MCAGYAVGITPRPGLAAYGGGRVVNADPIRISVAQSYQSLINTLTSGGGRKDKALTTMPSRLRDKSGHRRKAFLPTPLTKVVPSRLPRNAASKKNNH